MTAVPFKGLLKYWRAIFPILFFVAVLSSCTKTDFTTQSSQQGFQERFFIPQKPVSPQIQSLISRLQQQNQRHNFVNTLPENIGLPHWEKMLLVQGGNILSRTDSSGGYMIIPFTVTGTYLEGLLLAIPQTDSSYRIVFYSKEFLKEVCTAANKNVQQAENLLGIFMVMENYFFDREDFYHIPTDIFPTNVTARLTDSTKVASVSNQSETENGGSGKSTSCTYIPSGVHHPNEEGDCDWRDFCPYCTAIYCVNPTPELPEPPAPPTGGGGGTGGGTTPPPTNPPGGGGGGGGTCTNCPPPPGECRTPFYIEDPCAPQIPPLPTDTIPTSEILQMLHDDNVAIKQKRDSVWDLAYSADEEYHFFIKRYNGIAKAIGITTDHDPDGVTPNRIVQANSDPDGDYHTHQDHPSGGYRHPHDPQDVLISHGKRPKLYYRSYVDCGDTLYVIVTENLNLMKAFFRSANSLAAQDAFLASLNSAGPNRRSLGLALLIQFLGNSSTTGLGLYKSINSDKTTFIKIN